MTDPTGLRQLDLGRRVLAALYRISVASRGQNDLRAIFEAIAAELRTVFRFDAAYIAVCDVRRPGSFRAALLIDGDSVAFEEDNVYGSLTGTIVTSRAPLLFRDLAQERRALASQPLSFGSERSSRGWMGVPLVLGAEAVGVISLQSYQAGEYDEVDLDALQQVGNLVAVIVENATLSQAQRDLSAMLTDQVVARSRELAAIGELAADMVRRQARDTLLTRALARICELFGIDAGIVRLFEESDTTLTLAAQHRMPEEYMRGREVVPVAGTLIGRAISENRALVVGPEFAAGMQERGLPFKSVISVPLRIGDQVLGGMSLLCLAPRRFTPEETGVALALANQVAIAIENARLFAERERRVVELSALGTIARAASTALDLGTLLRQVERAVATVLPLEAFSMVVYDPERHIITDGISIDEGAEYTYWRRQPPPPDSLTAWVLGERRPLHFDDLAAEIEAYPAISRRHVVGSGRDAVSWLGVPLLSRTGDPIGVIAVQGYSPGMFSAQDESFLNSVAGQVALHVQNVGLLARRERQIRELDAIAQISRHVSAGLTLEGIMRPVYEVLLGVAPISSFFLIICDPESLVIRHGFYIDGGEEQHHSWPDGRPPAGSLASTILASGSPLLFDDIQHQEEQLRAVGARPVVYGSEDRPRSWAGVPLLDEDARPIGVIALQDSRAYQYDQQTLEFVAQVAAHISLGVQKIGLFEAERTARRTADTLREVARVLSSTFDLEEMLEIILRELQQVVPYDTASIMLLDGALLRVVALRGWDEHTAPRAVSFTLGSTGGAALVVHERQPIIIDDTRASPVWKQDDEFVQVVSWLGVPLLTKGRLLGVLNIDAYQPGHFTQRDAEVALAFASQAAVSLENARLYAESVSRVEQELALARQLQSNLFPRALPQLAGMRVAARCVPARETGGDFYDSFLLPGLGGDVLALMVGDASGKSIPGAMLMAVARSVARSEARDHVEPATVMGETNQLVAADIPRGSFVALSYATVDPRRRTLSLASAGQVAPLRRRADGQIEELLTPQPRLPLGIIADLSYRALEVELAPGDMLVFVTDGVVEAHDAERRMFGFERLEALVRDHPPAGPEALVDDILAAVEAYIAPAAQHDDMTVFVLQVDM